jgi:hypothetical protein
VSGESKDGPVARFDVVPAGTPVDSIKIRAVDWGNFDPAFPNNHPCYGTALGFGQLNNAALRFDVSELPPSTEVAEAYMDVSMALNSWNALPGGAVLWAAQGAWLPCLIGSPGPPFPNAEVGILAYGRALISPRARYEGAPFTGWLQEKIAGRLPVELIPGASQVMVWVELLGGPSERPSINVRYYRLPAPARSVTGGAAVHWTGGALRAERPRP